MSAHDELADSAARSRVGGRLDPSQSAGARSSDPDAAHGTAARARSGSGPHAQSLSTCRWPRGFNQTFIGNASPANGERARRSSMWCVSTHPHVRHVRCVQMLARTSCFTTSVASQETSSRALCADTPCANCAGLIQKAAKRGDKLLLLERKGHRNLSAAGPAATQLPAPRVCVDTQASVL